MENSRGVTFGARILFTPWVSWREKLAKTPSRQRGARGKTFKALLELVRAIVARRPIIGRVFPDEMAFVRFAVHLSARIC